MQNSVRPAALPADGLLSFYLAPPQIALQHIKDQAKQAKRDEIQRETVDAVKEAHAAALKDVSEAVQDALTQVWIGIVLCACFSPFVTVV